MMVICTGTIVLGWEDSHPQPTIVSPSMGSKYPSRGSAYVIRELPCSIIVISIRHVHNNLLFNMIILLSVATARAAGAITFCCCVKCNINFTHLKYM